MRDNELKTEFLRSALGALEATARAVAAGELPAENGGQVADALQGAIDAARGEKRRAYGRGGYGRGAFGRGDTGGRA